MLQKNFTFSYEEYDSIEELSGSDAFLVKEARNATKLAYAHYSNFLVGSFASLKSGDFVKGSNQENASYPVGICAERACLWHHRFLIQETSDPISSYLELRPNACLNQVTYSVENSSSWPNPL